MIVDGYHYRYINTPPKKKTDVVPRLRVKNDDAVILNMYVLRYLHFLWCLVYLQNGKCHFNQSLVVAKIKDYTNVTSGNQTELRIAIATKGPVAVGIDASHLSFAFYSDGVYYEKDCGKALVYF